jgi:restriction system protein
MSKKPSLVADIVTLTSRLPWWVGLLLAVVSYFGLHWLAGVEMPTATKAADAGPVVIWQFARMAGTFLQYLVPLLCVVGVVVSLLSGRRRKALGDQVRSGARGVGDLDWREFERLVGAWFEQRGFRVRETAGGADGGVDLYATRDGERVLVQCKHWRARKVGVEPVRELYGVLAASRGAGAYVVTSGEFTKAARDFALGREIQLVDGSELRKALAAPVAPVAAVGRRQVADLRVPAVDSRGVVAEPSPVAPVVSAEPQASESSPACPRCGAAMTRRVARTGARAGQSFWGCSTFPNCRGAREIGG